MTEALRPLRRRGCDHIEVVRTLYLLEGDVRVVGGTRHATGGHLA